MLKLAMKPVSFFLVFSFALLNFNVHRVQAQMVDTHTVIAEQEAADKRARVADFLAREEVKEIMIKQGIDTVEAQKRLASLSDAELTKIAESMNHLPAGGDGLGTLVGAAVFIFVVLLITDILGYTHVFSFVKHQR